jgi:protocatechuate 3,4-dioxygenase beta subunit
MEGVKPALVGGVVRDAAGEPVALARVSFTAGPTALPDIAALTDATGRFTLSAPQPGRYEISVVSDDAGASTATVEIPTGGARVQIDLPRTPHR